MDGFSGIVGSFLILILVILGIAGTMYHAIGPDGWIDWLLGRVFSPGVGNTIAILLAIVLAVVFGRRWLRDTQSNKLFNDFIMYAVAALGLFFAGRLVMLGTL